MDRQLRRRNRLTALLLGLFALVVFVTSFPFWQSLFQQLAGGSE